MKYKWSALCKNLLKCSGKWTFFKCQNWMVSQTVFWQHNSILNIKKCNTHIAVGLSSSHLWLNMFVCHFWLVTCRPCKMTVRAFIELISGSSAKSTIQSDNKPFLWIWPLDDIFCTEVNRFLVDDQCIRIKRATSTNVRFKPCDIAVLR